MKDLDSIYFAARDLPPEDRAAWLAQACGDDGALRARVERMLAVTDQAEAFIADPGTVITPPSEQAGERIGRYKLLQEIGEGGFGTVWMAEQVEPVSRRVALKIIKLGMDTKEVIARFEAERQALAMMDHPNIAKVLDAGATDKGRPFFVMELVKGMPVTQYCDEAGLGTRERLALFGDVCAAINHAHQKGVIHRDIKPSNVMVTLYADKPVVKVIDFGIAKATQSKLTDKTLFTRFEQFIGTPVYMSPEQAAISAVDIDTRSDIYSLGILLYELLTGRPPFDARTLASAGYEEMRRIIREVEPPKPSSRLSTVAGEERTILARARRVDPDKLNRLVEPDLDWIVMKAIEKDRSRRYDTANGLALDIQRFLNDEPVSATPPGAGYRFRKFARRNKTALRVAAGIAALLVAATAVSTWQAVRATQAEQQAKQNATTAHTEATRASEQKQLAEENLIKAEKAQKEANAERIRANREADDAQQNFYYAHMNLGLHAWRDYRGLARMREILGTWIPANGSPDRRGWEWFYLNSLPFQNVRTLGQGDTNTVVAWNAARNWLAEGTNKGVVRIWDVEREQPVRTLRVPAPGAVFRSEKWLAWNPDGSRLVSSESSKSKGTVHVWDSDSGKELRALGGHQSPIRSVAFSSDGGRVAAWGEDGAIKIWDARTGQLTSELTHPHPLHAGAWSPDDKLIASGGDSSVTISGTHANDKVVTLTGHSGSIADLAWSPDSAHLASRGALTEIWDVAGKKVLLNLPQEGRGHGRAIAWEPNGKRIATAGDDINLWDATTGRKDFVLHGNPPASSLAWGPDSRLAFAGWSFALETNRHGPTDAITGIWTPNRDQELSSFRADGRRLNEVAWSPDGKRLATCGSDGIRVWNAATFKEVLSIKAMDARALSWSPDGRQLAAIDEKGIAKVWDASSGGELYALPGDDTRVWSIAWSPNGVYLAASAENGTVRVVEWKNKNPKVQVIAAHKGLSFGVAWSPRGDALASCGADEGYVKIWDPVLGTERARMKGRARFLQVAWSPDGKRLAASSLWPIPLGSVLIDPVIHVWDAETGESISTMRGHTNIVSDLAWSPDGKRLASSGEQENLVRISDPATGRETFALRDIAGSIQHVSWHPDGAMLAGAGSDGQVWIWDATRGFERDTTLRALPYIERRVAMGNVRGEDFLPFVESYIRAGKPGAALSLVNDDPDRLSQVARRFDQHGDAQFAEAARVKALALLESHLKGTEPDTGALTLIKDLANDYLTLRNYARAELLLSDLLARARQSADTHPWDFETQLEEMGDLRYRQKRYTDAEALYRERIESRLRRPGSETGETVPGAKVSLARLYTDWAWDERATGGAAHQRSLDGEKLLRENIALRGADPKYPAWKKADLQSRLGGALSVVALTDAGLTSTTREPKLVEAEAILLEGQAGMDHDTDTESKYRRDGIERLIRLYEAWPKPDKLAEWKQKLSAFDEAEDRKNKPARP